MKCLRLCALAVAVATMVAGKEAAAQLVNPGFETDAVLNGAPTAGATGWITTGNASTTSANGFPVLSGIGSLRLVGAGNFSVPIARQEFPASPGQIWDLQGHMLTPTALPANATFGLLKIVWGDAAGDLQVPGGSVLIGQAGPVANPGVESLPFLNNLSTPNTWVFTQARGIAPPGTTRVNLFAIFVDQSAGTGYFDDLRGSLIPEPASIALMGLAMFGGAALVPRRRTRQL